MSPPRLWTGSFTLSLVYRDFQLGKTRSLTWHLLRSFSAYTSSKPDFPAPSLYTADQSFRRFMWQTSVAILSLASLAWDGAVKEACDAAICLGRLHFSLMTFSILLLLMNR